MTTTSVLSQVNAARLEGRLETVTQRQKEIQALHTVVRKYAGELHMSLLAEDSSRTEVDVLIETNVALELLHLIFDQISLKEALTEEKLVEQSKDIVERHDPLGNVLILSDRRMPLGSALVPLAYSIAAGNTPILMFSPDLPTFSRKLYEILQSSGLDREAIGLLVPESQFDREQMLSECSNTSIHGVFAQGEAETKLIASQSFLSSDHHVRLILTEPNVNTAIVSRNANIEEAAKEIVRANYGYGATPVAAPSFILVDEYVLQDFVSRFENAARNTEMRRSSSKSGPKKDLDQFNSMVVSFKRQGGRAIMIGDDKIMLVGHPDWKSLKPYKAFLGIQKTNPGSSGILCLAPTTGLEGALSFSTQLYPAGSTTSAVFIFAAQSESRYLSLFVPSSTTYVNHIPPLALFAPSPHLPVKSILYQIFSKPHPVFPNPSSRNILFPSHIFQQPVDSLIGSLSSILAAQNLGLPKQKSGKQIGFFLQGTMMGLSHLIIGLAVAGYGMRYFTSWALS